MPTKKPKAPAHTVITECNFHGGVSDRHADAVLALAAAMTEQAKAVQAIMAGMKGPDCLLKVGA